MPGKGKKYYILEHLPLQKLAVVVVRVWCSKSLESSWLSLLDG